MSKVIAFLYKHGKAMTSAVMLVTLGVTMMAGALLTYKSAEAATLTSVSDLVSESAPSSASNHTITFTAATAVANGGSISLTFDAAFAMGSVAEDDVDIVINSVEQTTAADCSGAQNVRVAVSAQVITLGLCAGDGAAISSGHVVVIEVGKNATSSGTGANQITNPSTSNASYSVGIQTKNAAGVMIDDATTYVAIVPTVELTAEVAPYFYFRVEGTASSAYDGITITSGSDDGWANFGVLTAGTPVTMASSLSAKTNATNGFAVTLEQNHNMLASSGADIDCFANGTCATPAAWSLPAGTLGSENTYGHLGLYSSNNNDSGLASGQWYGLNGVTQWTIWDENGAADGITRDNGTMYVLYRVAVSALQEVGRYENRLMYIGTATF